MTELADVFRLHGEQYRTLYGSRMPSSHLRVMRDIQNCRTSALGGQRYLCVNCGHERYSYHSCKNRHCPKCQNNQATSWLRKQSRLLLPVIHFLVTFTFPEELRSLTRSNQRLLYNILFRASSQALAKLAADPRYLGGQPGMVGVLHTWTRDLRYHPHVHYVVTGGGLDPKGRWRSCKNRFLLPGKPLGLIFRAKVRDELRKAGLLDKVNRRVWRRMWVVHLEEVGTGQTAFKYLAPYIFRVALTNNRIVSLKDGDVTFKYKDRATARTRLATLSAEEFIRRFLQHVLPAGFVKVRYYGLLSPSNRPLLDTVANLLSPAPKTNPVNNQLTAMDSSPTSDPCCHEATRVCQPPRCPDCGHFLIMVGVVAPAQAMPP